MVLMHLIVDIDRWHGLGSSGSASVKSAAHTWIQVSAIAAHVLWRRPSMDLPSVDVEGLVAPVVRHPADRSCSRSSVLSCE